MSFSTVTVLIAADPGRFVVVPFHLQEPIYLLLKRIVHMLKKDGGSDEDHALFVNGIPITDLQKPFSEYSIFGSGLTYQCSRKGKWNIHVTTLTGAAMDINCNSSDTIRQVKKTIYVKGWIHPQRHALFFRSRELENDKALGDYKIRFGSTLRSVRYLRGGGGLPFPGILLVKMSDTKGVCNFKFLSNAPAGRQARDGANVECSCECTPEYRVICPQGYGFLKISQTTLYCPICNQTNGEVIPYTVGFVNCKYRIHGIKATGEQYVSEWKIVKLEACYERFLPLSNMMFWRRLVIESASLEDDEDCTICLKAMCGYVQLACGHRFHRACHAAWGSTCPVCRFNRHLVDGTMA